MPVSLCRTSAALFQVESTPTNKDEEHVNQSSIWTMIQSPKSPTPNSAVPYVHPLVHRSPSLMSKPSLEMCTESLGSENGSGDFSDHDQGWLNSLSDNEEIIFKQKTLQQQLGEGQDQNQLMSVNYHCLASRRSPTPRSFPPPLHSIFRHDGNCIQMRTRRQDGRLVVDAVPAASQNFLHARRQDGRLLLSFVDTTIISKQTTDKATQEQPLKQEEQTVEHILPPSKEINQSQKEAGQEKEDEEEVEVLDRGSLVEVKVSTQAEQHGAKKLLR